MWKGTGTGTTYRSCISNPRTPLAALVRSGLQQVIEDKTVSAVTLIEEELSSCLARMKLRGMNQRYSSWQLCVLECYCIAAILLLLCCCAVNASKGNFDKLFVFGDSFVDIGNRDPNNSTYTAIGRVNQNWEPPYGRTHPGEPAGRYSDGKVLTDLLADYMGLKPRPYRLLNRTADIATHVSDGINFAVSGSGVFDNLGFTKTEDQITQLKEVLKTPELYPKDVVQSSLVLYMVSGNDYAAYLRNSGSADVLSVIALVASIVGQMTRDMTTLYDMGFRSFVVGKLAPVGCMPFATVRTNFSSCEEEFNNVITLHNLRLMARLVASFPHADILFLNNQIAFATVLYNSSNPDRLKACCNGVQSGALCGDLNKAGTPLSKLCSSEDTAKFFWWDEFHPTEAGWGFIFDLFLQGFPFLYTDGKSLPQFLGVRENLPKSKRSIKSTRP